MAKKIKYVSVENYKGVKEIIKYYSSGRVYQHQSNYRKRKLRDFAKRIIAKNKTAKERKQIVEDFKKYVGIKKDNYLSYSRKKANLRKEDKNWVVAIRKEKEVSKSQIRSLERQLKKQKQTKRNEQKITNEWEALWQQMKGVLIEYNLPSYWTDFVSDMYPDWVERAREACEDIHPFVEDISGEQFLELCEELLKRYGW